MILEVQFALSTDDPYPSSNWIIVLHTGLSVEKLERWFQFGGSKYAWNVSSRNLSYSDSFWNYLGTWKLLKAWKKFGELKLIFWKEDRERIESIELRKWSIKDGEEDRLCLYLLDKKEKESWEIYLRTRYTSDLRRVLQKRSTKRWKEFPRISTSFSFPGKFFDLPSRVLVKTACFKGY